jgi:hypothetical protein
VISPKAAVFILAHLSPSRYIPSRVVLVVGHRALDRRTLHAQSCRLIVVSPPTGLADGILGTTSSEQSKMELAVAAIALLIACWQLKLQRDEIRVQSQINSLIHVAELLERKIQHHERIIEDLKSKRYDWGGHATRVNKELRPLLAEVHTLLLSTVESRLPKLDPAMLREALKLGPAGGAA